MRYVVKTIPLSILLCLCGGCQHQQKLPDVTGYGAEPSDAELSQRLKGLRLNLLDSHIMGVGTEIVWINEHYRIHPGETGKYPSSFEEAWKDITPYFLNGQLKDVKLKRLEPPAENRIYRSDAFTLSMFIETSDRPATYRSKYPNPKDAYWYLSVVKVIRVSP